MKSSELESLLPKWAAEFSAIAEKPVEVPHQFWKYISVRMADLGGVEQESDVIRVSVIGEWMRVRITGTGNGGMLHYELADSKGMGIVFPRDVHADDRGKLSDVLEQLAADGKVKEAGQ